MENKNYIDRETVDYIAKLSRLSLSEEQAIKFQKQISDILGYINQLKEVDTDNVLPTSHVISSMKNVFREDKVKESLSQSEVLTNAPDKEDKFFKVPKIIKDK